MSELDRVYALRHPLKWTSFYWPHVLLTIVFLTKGWLVTAEPFEYIAGYAVWPPVMWGVAALVTFSAFTPLSRRIQYFTAASIAGLATFRILAYIETVWHQRIDTELYPVAFGLAVHWVVIGAIGAVWPRVSALIELRATTHAGREMC